MSKPARFPDFFLVGAPRCGTTALSRYLDANPQVCFSRPKEPHYFSLTAARPGGEDLEASYLSRYFAHHRAEHRAIGEGSVSYLYAPHAIERIRRVNPRATFIAILRNPLEMLPSYHLRMRYILAEDVPDFATAWSLQEARARGEKVPRRCPDPRMLAYRQVASFGAQVEDLYRTAGRDRCLVLVFDDLARDPGAVYRQVLAFIGVDDDGRTSFPSKLSSRIYRSRWLQQILYAVASRSGRAPGPTARRRATRNKRPSGRKALLSRVARWNRIRARPAPLDPVMRDTLVDTFARDVATLSRLLDRDLGHWLKAPPAAGPRARLVEAIPPGATLGR
jgi:hypothetical protein